MYSGYEVKRRASKIRSEEADCSRSPKEDTVAGGRALQPGCMEKGPEYRPIPYFDLVASAEIMGCVPSL